MTARIQRQFSVSDVADDHVWLKLLEGEKKGLEFAAYADSETLEPLEEGDKVTVTMKSRNQRNTEWEVVKVSGEELANHSSPVPADD
ncbi:hypothetical protein [Haloparvum sp. PAK95]|uniref:hypothetical protein n=1 Tax=Haloparvum sp. PAK95 TaxID=3418962 RepID=UPI003D2F26F8